MPNEYVIWGIPKDQTEETLLLAQLENKPITDKAVAERMLKVLSKKYGCTDLRIQTIDFTTKPDFTKAINE